MMRFYVAFGADHLPNQAIPAVTPDDVLIVDAASHNQAREKVVALLGQRWSGLYEHDRDRMPVADKWARWFPGAEYPIELFAVEVEA